MGMQVAPSDETTSPLPILKGIHVRKQQIKNEKKWKQKLLEKASKGNGSALALVGDCYYTGSRGFEQDYKRAFAFFKRADAAGNVWGTVNRGYMLVLGQGVFKNVHEGMMYIGIAAERGNDTAAALLGQSYADGLHGLPSDNGKSIFWLRKALSDECSLKSMTTESRESTRRLLDQELRRQKLC